MRRSTRITRAQQQAEAEERDLEEQEEEEHDDGDEGEQDDEGDEEEADLEHVGSQKRKELGLGSWDGGHLEVEAFVKRTRTNEGRGTSSKISDMEDSNCKNLLGAVMRFILYRNITRKPCRVADIMDNVVKPSKIPLKPAQRVELFHIIQDRFLEVFGYYLISTADGPSDNPKAAKENDAKKAKVKVNNSDNWVLLSLNDPPELREKQAHENDEENPDRAMALVILSIVMLHDSKVSEKDLCNALQELGIPEQGSKRKGTFQDALSAIKRIRDLGYLTLKKVDSDEKDGGKSNEYHFGPKALLEIGLPNILRFMEKITNIKLDEKDAKEFLSKAVV